MTGWGVGRVQETSSCGLSFKALAFSRAATGCSAGGGTKEEPAGTDRRFPQERPDNHTPNPHDDLTRAGLAHGGRRARGQHVAPTSACLNLTSRLKGDTKAHTPSDLAQKVHTEAKPGHLEKSKARPSQSGDVGTPPAETPASPPRTRKAGAPLPSRGHGAL